MGQLFAGAIWSTTKSNASPGLFCDAEIPPVVSTAAGVAEAS